jgi:AcrR family transcriptional regulator
MTGDRRKFRREGEERRRDALISAALELVAEKGVGAATVRAIADRAGVTAGLIGHYFASKEELTRAAYMQLMSRITEISVAAAGAAGTDPKARLSAYILASLRPPVLDGERIGLWAGFLNTVRRDPAMMDVHRESYLHYRGLLQEMIMQVPGYEAPERARTLAIAVNAMLDGLWMEGGLVPDVFADGEIQAIALRSAGAVLGFDLPELAG